MRHQDEDEEELEEEDVEMLGFDVSTFTINAPWQTGVKYCTYSERYWLQRLRIRLVKWLIKAILPKSDTISSITTS